MVYASRQYGPRLLSNFIEDRGNQATPGAFIATILYCLLMLRTIRSPGESGGVGFVPNRAFLAKPFAFDDLSGKCFGGCRQAAHRLRETVIRQRPFAKEPTTIRTTAPP